MSESSIGIQLLHPFCFTNPGKWSDGFNEHGIFEIVGLDELSGRVPKATIRRIASFKADCMIGEVAKTPTHRIKSRAVRTSLHSFSEHADFNQLTAAQSRVVELERSRDAWEKHCNEIANKKDSDIQRLELEREQIEKRELALRTQLVALYCRRQPDPGIAEWYTIRITKDHADRIMEALAK